jgi:hypothetical protein
MSKDNKKRRWRRHCLGIFNKADREAASRDKAQVQRLAELLKCRQDQIAKNAEKMIRDVEALRKEVEIAGAGMLSAPAGSGDDVCPSAGHFCPT